MTDYPDFQWMGESFTPDLFWEQVDTTPLRDAIEERRAHLWLAIMWKVWEHHKEQVKRDILKIIELENKK